jgi:hypothetical protein
MTKHAIQGHRALIGSTKNHQILHEIIGINSNDTEYPSSSSTSPSQATKISSRCIIFANKINLLTMVVKTLLPHMEWHTIH